MNLVITSPISEDKFGGPVQVIHDHMTYLEASSDHEVSFVGLVDNIDDYKSKLIDFEHTFLKRQWPYSWSYSNEFGGHIQMLMEDADLVHGHMLWDFTTFAASRSACRSQKPFVITPHGSVLGNRGGNSLKKKLYRKFILSSVLKHTAAMQALTTQEEHDLRKIGYEGIIEIIPNGVNDQLIYTRPQETDTMRKSLGVENKRIALFLGRLWEGKGLIELLDAWGNLQSDGDLKDWVLLCVGPDYRGFKKILKNKIVERSLHDKVRILSPMYGDNKLKILDLCDLFILPSHEEAFSMSILEAASRGKPVLYTKQCNFSDLSEVGGGWEIENNLNALQDSLRSIISSPSPRLNRIGNFGKQLITEKYTNTIIGQALTSFYSRLIS